MVQLPLHKTLKNGIPVELAEMQLQEQAIVRTLFNAVILEGQTYPQKHPLSEAEFAAYWMTGNAFVVRRTPATEPEILAAFYIKPNFPGRSSHICNAGFIVQPALRGLGIGYWMGETMLELARNLGYQAVMFNLVFATNIASIHIWKSLDFEIIGRIPNAVYLANGQCTDALTFYRSLT
jgi:ribosomal protein S18 acetylase RimI-like enzyme